MSRIAEVSVTFRCAWCHAVTTRLEPVRVGAGEYPVPDMTITRICSECCGEAMRRVPGAK